ncbi:MAG TPA: serine/threonine-protein kinase, partial [Myxococcota bacterium]|nr:serine/threonine-protein kinase [Myxococcota bacterium]
MAVLQPGTPFAFYRVEGLIGRGGMGEVYAAYDPRLQRRVALKLLPPERASDPDARLRMLREARSGSALRHPGIVTIYDVGEDAGRVYIAMEWVEGQTLAEAIRKRGKLPVKEALELFRQIGAAVAAAHAAGVLHRDLKTANLMVDAHGRIRVLDFGLSKRMVEHPVAGAGEARTLGPADTLPVEQPGPVPESPVLHGSVRTRVGARMGTPGSSAPELLRGEPADVRSDVFSLGVILYELLTGQPPYRADTLAAMEAAMLREQYLPISRLQPSVPSEVVAVVARALKPEPADRFPGVEAMVAALPSGRRPRPGPLLALGLVLGAGALLFRGWTPAPDIGQPVPLTQTGGCAYAPAFIDNQTVVYDDADGADTDLWVVSLAGIAPRRLTDVPGTSWR